MPRVRVLHPVERVYRVFVVALLTVVACQHAEHAAPASGDAAGLPDTAQPVTTDARAPIVDARGPVVDVAACPAPVPTSDEAMFELDRLAAAATAYLHVHGNYPRSDGATQPTGTACTQPGGVFQPVDWSLQPGWTDLGFSIGIPNRYSYTYIADEPQNGGTVTAIGDLDCDGDRATYTLTLEPNGSAFITPPLSTSR